MHRRRIAALIVCLVFVAACGSRLSDEDKAALETSGLLVDGRVLGGGDDGQPGGAPSAGGTVQTTVPGAVTTTPVGGAPATTVASGQQQPSTGGDGQGTATTTAPTAGDGQPTATTAPPAAGSSCGGGGASDVGVSETEIRVGNVSTISGPIPGFGQTGVNAVKAYVNLVNNTGGVCGRQLVFVGGDDRLQSGTNKSEHDKYKDEVFAFVGGTTVVDDGGAQTLEGTNIPDLQLAITDARIALSNNFSPTPIDLEQGGNGIQPALEYIRDTFGVSRAGLIAPAQAAAKNRIESYERDLTRAGFDVVFDVEVSVTETNYADDAAAIEDAGVEVLLTALELSGMARLAKALDQNGYFPQVPYYGAQAYGKKFLEQAGSAAEPTILVLQFTPFEDAGRVPAVQDFLTWYEGTNPGADIDFFAIQAWIAADMFVRGLRGIDGPPTRDKLLAELATFTEYTGDGFTAPMNVAQKRPSRCFLLVEVDNGAWKRRHPASGYDCSR